MGSASSWHGRRCLARELFTDLYKAMAPYMLFNNSICQFQVLAACSEGLSLLSLQSTLADVSLKRKEGVDTAAFRRPANMNDALRFVTDHKF